MSQADRFEAYFDFDNTIAEIDVLDEVIQRYSIDQEWRAVEASWQAGEIGSRECLERQLAHVRITPAELDRFLATIRIDPAFPAIVTLLREQGVELMILSDSFAPLIHGILGHHGLPEIAIRCNELHFDGDRPRPAFPYHGSICTECANCKTSHLMRRNRPAGLRKIYVGDGRSDTCPAGFCEVLFAKSSLLAHYRPLRPDVIAFERLATVHTHLLHLLS